MKKLIGAAMAAGATVAGGGVAHAEITANVQLTSDYVWRGISLADNGPAIQGGVDWTDNQFYVGTFASSLNQGMELDVYAGWTPATGPVTWDIGVTSYNYPGADDDGAEFDYFEFKVAGSVDVMHNLSVGAAVNYSPANYGDTGTATYWEVNSTYTVNDKLNFSAAFGNQEIDDPDGPGPITHSDSYNTWNIGANYTFHSFQFDLRYHDTDIKAGSPIEAYTYGPSSYDAGVTFTIKHEM